MLWFKNSIATILLWAVCVFSDQTSFGVRPRYLFDQTDSLQSRGKQPMPDNENGFLAWHESRNLEAYLDMYKATADTKYLDKFQRAADQVIALSDENTGRRDYKGRLLPGWGSSKYSNHGERIVWLVHIGMITSPLAEFSAMVKKRNLIQYRSSAERYVAVAQKSLSIFDSNWVFDPKSGEGHYTFDLDDPQPNNSFPPMPLPFNQQLAAGKTFLFLNQWKPDSARSLKISALAKHFKNRLTLKGDGSYVWNYWYDQGIKKASSVEDLAHGSIDVDFAILAAQAGIVFNQSDLKSFAKTYRLHLRDADGCHQKVDGTGRGDIKELGLWLELARIDPEIGEDYRLFINANVMRSSRPSIWVLAKLSKFDITSAER